MARACRRDVAWPMIGWVHDIVLVLAGVAWLVVVAEQLHCNTAEGGGGSTAEGEGGQQGGHEVYHGGECTSLHLPFTYNPSPFT